MGNLFSTGASVTFEGDEIGQNPGTGSAGQPDSLTDTPNWIRVRAATAGLEGSNCLGVAMKTTPINTKAFVTLNVSGTPTRQRIGFILDPAAASLSGSTYWLARSNVDRFGIGWGKTGSNFRFKLDSGSGGASNWTGSYADAVYKLQLDLRAEGDASDFCRLYVDDTMLIEWTGTQSDPAPTLWQFGKLSTVESDPGEFYIDDIRGNDDGADLFATSTYIDLAADLAAEAALDTGAEYVRERVADLAAVAALDTGAEYVRERSADMASVGTLGSIVHLVRILGGTLGAAAALDASGEYIRERSADLAAAADLQALGEYIRERSADMASVAALDTGAEYVRERTADLAAVAALDTGAEYIRERSADMASVGELLASLQGHINLVATLASSAALDASGEYIRERSADMASGATLGAAVARVRVLAADLAAAGTLTAAHTLVVELAAALQSVAALDATGEVVKGLQATMAATATLDARLTEVLFFPSTQRLVAPAELDRLVAPAEKDRLIAP